MRRPPVRSLLIPLIAAAFGAPSLAEPAASPPGLEIPGDGDLPFEQHPAMILTERDLNSASGSDMQNSRGIALLNAGKLEEAERHYRAVLAEELAAPDSDPFRAASMEMNLGVALMRQGRIDEAEQVYRHVLEQVEWRPESQETVHKTCLNLGGTLALQGRFAEAEPLLRRAVEGTSKGRHRGTEASLATQLGLSYALLGAGKTVELAALLPSIETQIKRYNYTETELDLRLQRLQCLLSKSCIISNDELRAEASNAMMRSLPGGRRPVGAN